MRIMKSAREAVGGFTLVEIMIVVAIIALLAAIAIPNLLRAKISANDALAKGMLRSLSTSSETYATAHNGSYPTAMADLTGANPPYINLAVDPCLGAVASGFIYTCVQTAAGYTFTAIPQAGAGTATFVMSTGGNLQ